MIRVHFNTLAYIEWIALCFNKLNCAFDIGNFQVHFNEIAIKNAVHAVKVCRKHLLFLFPKLIAKKTLNNTHKMIC